MNKVLPIQVIVFAASFCFSSLLWAQGPRCSDVYSQKVLDAWGTVSPLEKTLAQLDSRLAKIDQTLIYTSPQSQRQAKKKMTELRKIVREFSEKGELSDKRMTRMLELTIELEKLERDLIPIAEAKETDVFNLRRYLFTKEPIIEGVEYFADLPGFADVKVVFSKATAAQFSQVGYYRDVLFSSIFRGKVGPYREGGIKEMTGESRIVDGIEYKVMVLKRIGDNSEGRVIVIHSSDGKIFFYKTISNYNRVEYGAVNEFLNSFFTSQRQEQ